MGRIGQTFGLTRKKQGVTHPCLPLKRDRLSREGIGRGENNLLRK